MTALDDDLVPVALALIDEFGLDATFTELAPQAYDPATGTVTDGPETVYTRKISPPDPDVYKYVPPDIAKEGDAVTFVAGSGLLFTPKPTSDTADLLVDIQGDKFRIVSVQRIRSGEETAAWMMHLRR